MGGLKSGDTGATKWVVPQPQPVSGSTTPRLVAGGRRRRHTRQTGSGTTTRGPTPGFVLAARYLQWYMPRHQSRLWGLRVTFPSEANAHPGVQRKLRFAWRVRATPAYQQRSGVAPGARQGRRHGGRLPARPPAEAGGRTGEGRRARRGGRPPARGGRGPRREGPAGAARDGAGAQRSPAHRAGEDRRAQCRPPRGTVATGGCRRAWRGGAEAARPRKAGGCAIEGLWALRGGRLPTEGRAGGCRARAQRPLAHGGRGPRHGELAGAARRGAGVRRPPTCAGRGPPRGGPAGVVWRGGAAARHKGTERRRCVGAEEWWHGNGVCLVPPPFARHSRRASAGNGLY
ncbi:unnamed protein product [Closterium sp. NIES-65]|nr:unnamed protein product [Closterium sp. NIES-65]